MNIEDLSKRQELIDIMRQFDSDEPEVGIFWYDTSSKELFGCNSIPVSQAVDNKGRRTYGKLHKTVWKKEYNRALSKNDKDSIYLNYDYTKIPRGRIFYENGKFKVMVGKWAFDKSVCDKDTLLSLVIEEFNLPEDSELEYSSHWDLGHGWSEEMM